MTSWPSEKDNKQESVADLVGEIVQQKKDKQAAAEQKATEKRQPRSLMPMLLVLTIVAVGLTAWNFTRATASPRPVSAEQRNGPGLVGIYVATQALDAYRDSTGIFPPSLEFVGAEGFGVTFVSVGNTYTLSVPVDTGYYVHQSGDALPELGLMMASIRSQ